MGPARHAMSARLRHFRTTHILPTHPEKPLDIRKFVADLTHQAENEASQ